MLELVTRRTTLHFVERTQKRQLKSDVLDFVLTYGTEFDGAGARHYTIVDKHLPRGWQNSNLAKRSRDWVVVVSRNGWEITCYRRREAARFVRLKAERHHGLARAA
jgi:hypothetical protein